MAEKRFMARNVTIEYEREGRQFEHTFKGPIRIIESQNGEMRLEDPSGKPLWGYAGDEIFLGSDLPKRKSKRNEQFYFPKIFHEDSRGLRRVALEILRVLTLVLQMMQFLTRKMWHEKRAAAL